jgi:hypothetical protein
MSPKNSKKSKGGAPKKAAKTTPKQRPSPKVKKPSTQKIAPKKMACMLTPEMTRRDEMDCLAPVQPVKFLKGSFAQSWGNLIDVIDSFLKIAAVHDPSLFMYDTDISGGTTAPSIGFSHARALWVLICQYFLFRRGIIVSTSSSRSTFVPPTKQLPIGIAKILQYYQPYVDPHTGAQYKVMMDVYPESELYWDYPSIDRTVIGTISTLSLSHPRFHVLSHPAKGLGDGLGQPLDAGIRDYETSGQVLSAKTDVYAEVEAMTPEEITTILSLFPVVDVDQLPTVAPDASMYCNYTPTGITCPVGSFDANIATLLNTDYSTDDDALKHPFIKPKVPIGIKKTFSNVADYTQNFENSDAYQTLLRNNYAYIMKKATHFSNGCWHECLAKGDFSGIRSLTVMGSQINTKLIGDAIAQLCPLHLNNPSDPSASVRTYWSFVTQCWGVICRRIHKVDVITDANTTHNGEYYNYYNGYGANSQYEQFKLPASLATTLNSIGPIVVKGYLYIPYFGKDPGHWLQSLSTTGVWDLLAGEAATIAKFGQSQWEYTGSKNVTYAGGGPISWDNTALPCKLPTTTFISFLTSNSQNMVSMPYNQGISPSPATLGNPYFILTPVILEAKKPLSTSSQAINGWYNSIQMARTGGVPRICTPLMEGKMAMQNGIISADLAPNLLYPCRAVLSLEIDLGFNLSQITYTGPVGNQNFVAMRQAMSDNATRGSVRTTKEGVKPLFSVKDGDFKSMAKFIVKNADELVQVTRRTKNLHKSEILPQIVDSVVQLADFAIDPSIEKGVTMLTDTIKGVSAVGTFVSHTLPKALKLIEHPNKLFKAIHHIF